jgi:hypothetical protein
MSLIDAHLVNGKGFQTVTKPTKANEQLPSAFRANTTAEANVAFFKSALWLNWVGTNYSRRFNDD